MSNKRRKLNLLAGIMAMAILPLMAYASYYLQQPITAQSSNDFDNQIKKSSILNKPFDFDTLALVIDTNYDPAINIKRLALDSISNQDTTSTTELSLRNKTDSNSTTNVINTIDGNSTTNFITYENSTYGITTQYPSDWTYVGHGTILQPPTQPIVTFTPIEPSDSTLVRILITRLTIEGQEQNPSLNQIAERTIGLNQQTLSDFKLNESRSITLKDGTAAHMLSYDYTDPDFGMTDAIDIIMIKGNNLYVIEYFAEPQIYPIHLPKFQTILDSLEVMGQ